MPDASGQQTATAPQRPNAMVTGRFVHNAWYLAAWIEELNNEKPLARTVLNQAVALFRQANGTPVALEDRCPHRHAPLSMGNVKGDRLQCAYHGLEFDATGACAHNPHGGHLSSRAQIKSYPLVEKHKAVWIWMGDEAPDPAKVPDFSMLDDYPALHGTKVDRITVAANYELICDNLLDLSHTAFLHAGILGNDDTAESPATVTQEGDDVIVERNSFDAEAPGLAANFLPGVERVDKHSHIRWMAPSNFRIKTGIAPHGAPADAATGYNGVHILTPETERTTHYFFTAVRFNVLTEGDELNRQIQDKVEKTRRFAFEHQDGPVIEAQQRILDAAPERLEPMILPNDIGPTRYKRILTRMLDDDRV